MLELKTEEEEEEKERSERVSLLNVQMETDEQFSIILLTKRSKKLKFSSNNVR